MHNDATRAGGGLPIPDSEGAFTIVSDERDRGRRERGRGLPASLWNLILGVVSSLVATAVVLFVGPFVPAFDVDRRRFFTVLLVAVIAYFTGALSYALVRGRPSNARGWWAGPAVLAFLVVAVLPAWVSVIIDDVPLLNWGPIAAGEPSTVVTERVTERHTERVTERPSQPPPVLPTDPTTAARPAEPAEGDPPSGPPETTQIELATNTTWDVDNWEEPVGSGTWDIKLGATTITFREFAEADAGWALADCEDPELRAWSGPNKWVRVDAEHDVFCMRTTTGATALLRVVKMPGNDQLVRTFTLQITRRT